MKDFNEVDFNEVEIENKLGEWFFEDHDGEVEDYNEFDKEMQEKMHELYCEEHDHPLLEYNYIVHSPVSELDYDDSEEFVEDPCIFTYEDYLRTGEFGVWGDGVIDI